MDIAALMIACSLYPDDPTLLSIVRVYGRSVASVYTVLDVSGRGLDPEEAAEFSPQLETASTARAALVRLIARGDDPVVGLLPARPAWASEFGLSRDALLDACSNIQIATAKLSEFDHECRRRGHPQSLARRACTLERYGRGLALPALARAVLADLTLDPPATAPGADEPPALALSLGRASELFFEMPPTADTPPPPSNSALFFEPPP